MKTKLLFAFLIAATLTLNAQTTETITIDWGFGSNPSQPTSAANYTNRTIEVGDTVVWMWVGDGGSHNVVSTGGVETFSSGATTSTAGNTFSHVFNSEGSTTFVCSPHSGNMNGTITVVAEGALSTEDFIKEPSFTISPNPSKERMNIELNPRIQNATLQVYDVLGKQIMNKEISDIDASINVSNWNKGIYIVRIASGDLSETKRFVKQ